MRPLIFTWLSVGLASGWASYRFRQREFGSTKLPYEGAAGGILFAKRLLLRIGSAFVCYYLWDLARAIR